MNAICFFFANFAYVIIGFVHTFDLGMSFHLAISNDDGPP